LKLAILYTGGTIGSVGNPLKPLTSEQFEGAFEKLMKPILQSRYPDLKLGYITFDTLPDGTTVTLDSTNLQPSDWCKMAKDILPVYPEHDAFLILHGTDTMAYTASALSFLFTGLQPDGFPNAVLSKPVVITGSQVPLFYKENDTLTLRFDTDAFQNVCGSVSAATTGVPEVCLFFHNTLFRGNRTAKTNASELDAFSSPNYPALGEAGIDFRLANDEVLHLPTTPAISLESDGARARLSAQLAHLTANIPRTRAMPFLAFPATYTLPGPDKKKPATAYLAALLTAALDQDLQGLVLESYGEGNFPSGDPDDATAGAIYQVLDKAHEKGVVIVDNTQVLAGIVNANAYASGSWLASVGAVGAFDMTPIASYAKLLYLLTLRDYQDNNWQQSDVERLMQTNVTGEIMDVNRLDTRGRWFLGAEESINALDGTATLINDPDLGPVLKDSSGKTLWQALSSPPAEGLPGRLYMQGDGNLVLYGSSNTVLWASGTPSASEATSMLILDGSTAPGGLRLYVYNYAQGIVSKTLFPPSPGAVLEGPR